jgi:hypothetical protein
MSIKSVNYKARSFSYLNLLLLIALGFFGICALSLTLNLDTNMFIGLVYASSDRNSNSNNIVLKDLGSFLDSAGRLNIIGVVDNNGHYPIAGVMVGLNSTNSRTSLFSDNFATSDNINDDAAHTKITSTVTASTFARVIYPGTGAPFKIVL